MSETLADVRVVWPYSLALLEDRDGGKVPVGIVPPAATDTCMSIATQTEVEGPARIRILSREHAKGSKLHVAGKSLFRAELKAPSGKLCLTEAEGQIHAEVQVSRQPVRVELRAIDAELLDDLLIIID